MADNGRIGMKMTMIVANIIEMIISTSKSIIEKITINATREVVMRMTNTVMKDMLKMTISAVLMATVSMGTAVAAVTMRVM